MNKNKFIFGLIAIWVCSAQPVCADIIIFGLEDFRFGKWVLGVGPLRTSSSFCVSVRPPAPYQVTAFGSGSSNALTLSNGFDSLPYRIFFNDRPRPNGASELQPGQALGGLRSSRHGQNRQQCNRPTANISILISETDLEQSSSGSYSGTVMLVVGPE